MTNEQLLDTRFRDLKLSLKGTWIELCVERLYRELDSRGIGFHPKCYLADEWLCPDREPVIGIGFYLAHPRLIKLEKTMMLEAEGTTRKSCMKLLRHEAGHAINYAYMLHRRKKWTELFGSFDDEYPERYRYRPYSKRFVQHLEGWYAQYHPDEDFAETFAVWLDPRSDWREKYQGWPALAKLEYIDRLAGEMARKEPRKPHGQKHWEVARMQATLRTHYKKRRAIYADSYPDFHDKALRSIFEQTNGSSALAASELVKQSRKSIRDAVAASTGERKFIIDELLGDIISRCARLRLTVSESSGDTNVKLTAYVSALTMNYRYTGSFKRHG